MREVTQQTMSGFSAFFKAIVRPCLVTRLLFVNSCVFAGFPQRQGAREGIAFRNTCMHPTITDPNYALQKLASGSSWPLKFTADVFEDD